MNPTLLRQHFARWNPLHFDSAGSPGTFRGGRINERSEERKQSYSVQSKGVSQPKGGGYVKTKGATSTIREGRCASL